MTSPHVNRRAVLGTGCIAHAAQDGMTASVYILLPILAQTFGLSYADVGLLKGLKNMLQGALELFSGFLSERFEEGRVILGGILLSGVGYLLLSIAPGIGMLVVCLLIVGAGTALQHSPASSLVSIAYTGHGRRSALGLYNSAGDIGKLGFSACLSLAIGAGFAWQQVSFAIGIVALVIAGVVVFLLNRVGRVVQETSTDRDDTGRGPDLGWGILNRPAFTFLLVTVFLDNAAQAGILVFVAFLMMEKGLPIAWATMATVVVLTGGVFGKAGCGYLAERLGVRPAFLWVQALTALLLVAVAASPSWSAYLLLLPLGVVAQGSTTITYGLVVDMVHPERIARGYAVMYGSTSFAAAIGPWLFGVIADEFNVHHSFIVIAIITLLAVPAMLLLPRTSIKAND